VHSFPLQLYIVYHYVDLYIGGGNIVKQSSNELDYSEFSRIEQCQNDWDYVDLNTCAVGCCRGGDDYLLICLLRMLMC